MPATQQSDTNAQQLKTLTGYASERFFMREITANDVHFYQQLYTHPIVMLHCGGALSKAAATQRFEALLPMQAKGRVLQYVVTQSHTTNTNHQTKAVDKAEAIGLVSFCWSKTRPGAEWGIMLLPQYGGRGIGSELLLASALFSKNQLRLNRLFYQTRDTNQAAINLVKHCQDPLHAEFIDDTSPWYQPLQSAYWITLG